ncbi:MAG: NADH-quinone oxidoreductase subunit NuoH [Planctomycetes bacterium]|nr:NADH-quinone oxidoreductase subunit NuoH [Planctomycetota bacterium]
MVASFVAGVVTMYIWIMRRVMARMQDRYGPNRYGPFGVLQAVADPMKLLFKEDIIPAKADQILHPLAPVIVLAGSLMVWAVIPWGPGIAITDLPVALLYIIAWGGLPTLGFLLAGWASYNKYALIGGMRAAAQFVSYEIPGVLAVLTPVLLAGTMSLQGIVQRQAEIGWFILYFPVGPLAFVLFVISGLAEANQTPFDLVEAESELTAGYHVEYSGIRWGLFQLAEYANVFALSTVGATLFLGGWLAPPLPGLDLIPPYVWTFGKAAAIMFVFVWVRSTLPRFRYDQLMQFAWKGLLPVALLNLGLAAVGMALLPGVLAR